MSFYRNLLAVVAAVVLISPVYAAHRHAAAPVETETVAQAAPTPININTALIKELMAIQGINAVKAKAILAYRKKHGMFKTLDALAKVKGFTRMKEDELKSIQGQLSLG